MENIEKYHARREEAKRYLGGICVVCGSTEELEFDHVEPNTKSFALSDRPFVNIELFWSEVDKCQLLCKPHHVEKTVREQKTRTHGTVAMYRREKCRCELCVRVNSEYQAKYSANRVWCKPCGKRYYKRCKTHAPLVQWQNAGLSSR